MLSLNQRTYLIEKLEKIYPFDDWWELTAVITEGQRGRLLALLNEGNKQEIVDTLDNIKNFQLMPNRKTEGERIIWTNNTKQQT